VKDDLHDHVAVLERHIRATTFSPRHFDERAVSRPRAGGPLFDALPVSWRIWEHLRKRYAPPSRLPRQGSNIHPRDVLKHIEDRSQVLRRFLLSVRLELNRADVLRGAWFTDSNLRRVGGGVR